MRVWGAGLPALSVRVPAPPRSDLSFLVCNTTPTVGVARGHKAGPRGCLPPNRAAVAASATAPAPAVIPTTLGRNGREQGLTATLQGSDPASTTDQLHAPGQPMPKRCTRGAARIQGELSHSRGPGPASEGRGDNTSQVGAAASSLHFKSGVCSPLRSCKPLEGGAGSSASRPIPRE